MRTWQWTLPAFLLSLAAACSGSPPQPDLPAPATTAPSEKPALEAPGEAKVGDRSTCMVSKEEFVITDASPKVEHEGKTYYFCCSGCADKFRADPAKFLSGGGG